MATPSQRKTLVQMEILIPVMLLLLVIVAYLAWVFYGNFSSGMYFPISEWWNLADTIVMVFFCGVLSTLFVMFFGAWAHMKMRYAETERQKLEEEIRKELETEKQPPPPPRT